MSWFRSRHPLRRALLSLLAASMLLGTQPVPAQLPSLGDAGEMPLSTERQLGDRIMREVYRDVDYLEDPTLTAYVQSVWAPLLHSARLRGELTPEMSERFAWEVLLVRERSVNAFALPGGYMGVHLGLIMLVNSRDELASVLAHELSHITQRHISRGFSQQSRNTPLMIAAMMLAVLAASKNPKVTEAVLATTQAAAIQSQLNFSRDMEREADRIGFSLMEPSGYQPKAFVDMFELLQRASRLNDNGNYPYLRSHPLTSERISDMQLRIGIEAPPATPVVTSAATSVGIPAAPPLATALPTDSAHAAPFNPTANPAAHPTSASGTVLAPVVVHGAHAAREDLLQRLMTARSRILVETDPTRWRKAITEWEAWRPSPTRADAARQAGMLYAAALGAIQLKEYDRAETWIAQLRTQVQDDAEAARAARWLQAEWAIAAQKPQMALALLPANSTDRVDLLLAAQAALQLRRQTLAERADQPSQARVDAAPLPWQHTSQRLMQWVQANPRDAQAWEALSALANAQGEPLRALRAEAEVRAARLNVGEAVDRLRAAQELARKQGPHRSASEHIDLSIIDSRMRELSRQLKEQQQENARMR